MRELVVFFTHLDLGLVRKQPHSSQNLAPSRLLLEHCGQTGRKASPLSFSSKQLAALRRACYRPLVAETPDLAGVAPPVFLHLDPKVKNTRAEQNARDQRASVPICLSAAPFFPMMMPFWLSRSHVDDRVDTRQVAFGEL